MAAIEVQHTIPSVPAGVLYPPSPEVRRIDSVWSPDAPKPNLWAHGMTEARCIFQYHYSRSEDDKLDALEHLANICVVKVGRAFWTSLPRVKFVDAPTSKLDWENWHPFFQSIRKINTQGWFIVRLPEAIETYSPDQITKRELMELARMRDGHLLHVCGALVRDFLDELGWHKRHELKYSSLPEGDELYWDPDGKDQTSAPTVTFAPDYAAALQELVRNRNLRDAMPTKVLRTLEFVLRRLASGVTVDDVLATVARDLQRNERTIRRYLAQARRATVESPKVKDVLGRFLLPEYQISLPSLAISSLGRVQ